MPRAAARDEVVFVGHATLLIELDGARVLTDPLLRPGIAHVRRRVPLPDIDELLPLDAVLISHAHADHLDPMSLRRVARECPVIAPRGCAGILKRSGVREVIEVEVGDRVGAGGVSVEAVPADHDGRRYPVGPPVAALGFLLDASTRVYFAGDTDLFDGMAALAGRVDLAALPIWGWGPRLPAGHLDPESAARAAALIRPAAVLPIHWGTLRSVGAQRDTDPMTPARRFTEWCARLVPATEVRVLQPLERLELASLPAQAAP
jgi:L-ascorbate metabolism protein UlaG (beta-lactamase superfamily)